MLQDELQNMHVWKLLSKGTRSILRKCSVTILPFAICRLQVMFSPKKRSKIEYTVGGVKLCLEIRSLQNLAKAWLLRDIDYDNSHGLS